MIKLLFDTDVLIEFLRGNQLMKNFLQVHKSAQFFISAMTVAELFVGARNIEEASTISSFLISFEVINVDKKIAERGGLLRQKYGKSHGVGLADAIIAASVESISAKLVTLNKKHYPMMPEIIIPLLKH